MHLLELAFLGFYFGVMLLVSLYGGHRYLMTYLYYRHKHEVPRAGPVAEPPPFVTVQLPLYNERHVCERLIAAVCALDYPRDRFEVQVLDDSTDETARLASAAAADWRRRGLAVAYLHRDDRTGYKAGALGHGLALARGELVAVFDADFVPAPDFLRRTVPFLADPGVGMVQVRWGHLNRDHSALTRAQAILLDGHFVIEHTARHRSGRFFNFNGTAGIWRRATILDAGAWQHDTLTEDLDLSYRAQLRGWRFVFLPEVVSPAELPVEMHDFKSQQHRWAKGSIQTARKLLPSILRAKLPLRVKVEAFFHLTSNLAYLLVVAIALLMPVAVALRHRRGWDTSLWVDLPFFVAATLSVSAFYLATQREVGTRFWRRLQALPFLLSLGIGMSINNARAVVEALIGHPTPFLRTPKYGVISGVRPPGRRRPHVALQPAAEIALGLYLGGAVWYAAGHGLWMSIPFLLLSQTGFLYVGLASLWRSGESRAAT